MKNWILTGVVLVMVIAVGYIAVTKTVWEMRYPKANWTTYWSEMPAPLRFERLEKYQ